jgi:hypothetical protein
MTYVLITIGVLALIWIANRLKNGAAVQEAFFAQVNFIRMYMGDKTEQEFYNKDVDEAIEFGQDMLWEAASDFNERMHRAVIEKEPVPMGDMSLIISAIKIVKAAESMVYIKKNGRIDYEEPEAEEEPVSEEK